MDYKAGDSNLYFVAMRFCLLYGLNFFYEFNEDSFMVLWIEVNWNMLFEEFSQEGLFSNYLQPCYKLNKLE